MHEPQPVRFPAAIIVPTPAALDVLATLETISDHLAGIGELAAAFDLDHAAGILGELLLEQQQPLEPRAGERRQVGTLRWEERAGVGPGPGASQPARAVALGR